MADATTTAKDRIDRALATLERRVLELKARPAIAAAGGADDLFAAAGADDVRVRELEAAGRDASQALARAADQLRDLLASPTASED